MRYNQAIALLPLLVVLLMGCQCDEFYTDELERMSVRSESHLRGHGGLSIMMRLYRASDPKSASRLSCSCSYIVDRELYFFKDVSISVYDPTYTKLYGTATGDKPDIELREVPERVSVICRFLVEGDADTTVMREERFEGLELQTLCRRIHGLH